MPNDTVRVAAEDLQAFVTQLFTTAGMSADDGAWCAQALVQTNLWGIASHGVLRVPIYVKRLLNGAVKAQPTIRSTRCAGALEVLDGDDGMGFVVGRTAMDRAIALASKHHVAAVGAIRSNHFGAAALYVRRAAEAGMIGIAMTNVVQNVVVPGGAKPVVGNNPLAVAVPTFGEFPFVLDISLSAVAGGKLLLASKKKEKIPLDWATDDQGRPTDDPDTAFAGFLLPMGGHKGFGLALVVEILCGVITGGVFLDRMKGMYKYPEDPSLTGHFMIAIDPLAIMEKDELAARMAQFTGVLKASPMWDDSREMLIPGEIEHRTAQRLAREGIELPGDLFTELTDLGRQLGTDATIDRLEGCR